MLLCLCYFSNRATANPIDTIIKTIAILPFTIAMDTTNLPNGVTDNSVIRTSDINSYRFQRALHTWFMKKRLKYKHVFQDISVSNDLLNKYGDSVYGLSRQKLCTLLGVDAIIYGNVSTVNGRETVGHEVMSQFGLDFGYGNKIKIELNLYNFFGTVLWKQAYQGSWASSPDKLIDKFMKKYSKSFPLRN